MSQPSSLATQQPRFSVAITTEGYQKLINNTLGDPARAKRFIAAITSAVAVNPALQECNAGTILAGALLGESLNLSPSPQLGHYYLVPFEVKAKGPDGKAIYLLDAQGNKLKDDRGRWRFQSEKKAQFVLGYKGYIQLAIRSGQYKKLNVLDIKEGELVRFDQLNEEIECNLIEDPDARDAAPTIGYYAMFEYMNGFRKALYWSKKKAMKHADQYSAAFSAAAYEKLQNGEIPESELWKYSSFWYKSFDDMAKKTMLRQLISRWGIMSIEMQTAFEQDGDLREMRGNVIIATPEPQIDPIPQAEPIMPEHPAGEQPAEQVDINEI